MGLVLNGRMLERSLADRRNILGMLTKILNIVQCCQLFVRLRSMFWFYYSPIEVMGTYSDICLCHL